jgi:Predicted integral membrane protein
VLPFQNMSGDPEQEYFADGMVEEIITGLSRLRWLFVTSRTSSFQFKGLNLDLREIARRLGVGYVLEGSVRGQAPASASPDSSSMLLRAHTCGLSGTTEPWTTSSTFRTRSCRALSAR